MLGGGLIAIRRTVMTRYPSVYAPRGSNQTIVAPGFPSCCGDHTAFREWRSDDSAPRLVPCATSVQRKSGNAATKDCEPPRRETADPDIPRSASIGFVSGQLEG